MANRVNPPPTLAIPLEFVNNKPVRDYLRQVETILFQLWQRVGGDTDIVEDNQQNITSSSSRVSRNAARINSLELKEFEIETTLTDTTTEEYQILICKNTVPITVTLDPNAIVDDEVHIKRRGESILVVGSIDGFTNKTINILNYNMHLVFDGVDWSEI
jgi:hypothetical protein